MATLGGAVADYSLTISDVEIQRYLFMAERARDSEAELWSRAGIVPGAVVADVGCGPAAVSVVMARLVEPGGRVIGIERDESSLAAARSLVAASGVDNVELRSGTATETGIPERSLDVVVMRHVLAHNGPNEQNIVNHLASLLRPGGHAYLVDVDGPAIAVLGADPELDDLIGTYQRFHATLGNDLRTGPRLGRLLKRSGLELVTHEGAYEILDAPVGLRPPPWAARDAMLAAGVITTDDVERWEAAFARTDAMIERPTMVMPRFVAIGVAP